MPSRDGAGVEKRSAASPSVANGTPGSSDGGFGADDVDVDPVRSVAVGSVPAEVVKASALSVEDDAEQPVTARTRADVTRTDLTR
jgi:hypothetical protein